MFNKPSGKPDFFKLEEEVLKWWKENQTFEKSVKNREGAEDYIFYDGPPFMSGMPHYATLLSSLPKDVVPRYQTMKGKKVERVWGWDCHGLPIENKVEKEMGISNRKEIEDKLEEFIQKCYEWNRVGIENWQWYIDHIGRWADLDNAYRTLDQEFMESVWWVFKTMWDKGLVYKGKRTSLFSTDSSTPVSNFEVSMDPDNYQETEDIAVTVKFKLKEESLNKISSKVNNQNPTFLLAWTTTPWTLPSNFALAVNPEAEYVVVRCGEENYILNNDRLEHTFENSNKEHEIITSITSDELEGLEYEQLYPFLKGNSNDFKVYKSEYVTTEDGSGVLHVAPAFGEEDFNLGKQFGLSDLVDINDDGKLIVGPWEGVYLRDANPLITEDLANSGKLFKQEKYIHKLPFYRYKNPLIYKTQENYFINVQTLKEKLMKSNENINWIPDYFKEGRFKYILETAPDWSISRSRYWGTAMPLWRNEDGEEKVVGSRDDLMNLVNKSNIELKIRKVVLSLNENSNDDLEKLKNTIEDFVKSSNETINISSSQENLSKLRELFFGETDKESKVKLIKEGEERAYYLLNTEPLDLHRPYIDKIYFTENGKKYTRIKDTMDVWMDSGSMPFAQFHYPFTNKEKFEHSFPGDFIAEYTGQIRAWFYVLHVISNAVFDSHSFKNVLVTGVLAGTDGRKMSKSYGNYPDPKQTIEKYGGEALRLYFLGSTLMNGNDMNFSEEDLRMQLREILIPLWNILSYITTYANIHNWTPTSELVYNSRKNFEDSHPWDHIPFDDIENELDEWIILKLQQVIKSSQEALDSYEIPKALNAATSLINDISKWYIRRSRDRFAEGDQDALNTLYYVFIELIKLLAPFIPFVTEYIYKELVGSVVADAPESIHLCDYPEADQSYLDQYSLLDNEMKFIQEIAEMGHSLRVQNQLKVRQPLEKLEVINTNPNVPELAQWMQDIICNELNVRDVVEVLNISKSETILVAENSKISVKIGLETQISEELMKEGVLREIVRNIQSERKNSGMKQGELVNIEYSTSSDLLNSIMEERNEYIKKIISADSIEKKDELVGEDVVEFSINDDKMKIKIKK